MRTALFTYVPAANIGDVEAYISQHEVLRDGRDARKAPRRKAKARMMTNEEAQEFFAGIKTVDGVLESSANEIVN